MSPESGSAAVLSRMESLYPEEISLELSRVVRLLEALGSPHEALPSVVHVAGTNGKGSVIAFLKAMLEAAGAAVHVFTSPHLTRFHERIALARPEGARPIGEDDLTELLLRVEAANAGEPITFFEITTAAAFLAFAEQPADFVLLETGLGGRLDATNVVAQPALTVITPISRDHERFLGDTIAKIAGEKAGILKAGVPLVLARQQADALEAIEDRAAEVGAPVIAQGRDWDAFEQHGRLIFQTEDALLDLPAPRLLGRHQIDNAGVSIAALRALPGMRANESAVADGLLNATWPARLQRLTDGPLQSHVLSGTEILLDGGHNAAAGEALAHAMAELEEVLPRPLHLICGMMNTKDAAAFFAPFSGLAAQVVTVPIPGSEGGHDPVELAEMARSQGLNATPVDDVVEALRLSSELADLPVRVLICGSLYLAGDVLRQYNAELA